MTGFAFSGSVILRSPGLSFKEQDLSLKHLLGSLQFRIAIFFASPSLYTELSKNGFEYSRLAPQLILSLRRYHNRMCYRPTPFGLFATVSVINWGDSDPILLAKEDKLVLMPGFKLGLEIGRQLVKDPAIGLLYINPSMYELPGEYRYYRLVTDDTGNRFVLRSVKKSHILKQVLKCGRTPQPLTAFIERLSIFLPPDEAKGFLGQLTVAQVLLSSLLPNITGEPYWKRMSAVCGGQENKDEAREPAESFINSLMQITNSSQAALYDLPQLPLPAKVKDPFNVLAFRGARGSLSTSIQQKLMDAVECLRRIVPADQGPGDLKNFARQFNSRFEGQEIPLLKALDPETGISYGGTDRATGSFDIADMLAAERSTGEPSIEWSTLSKLLFAKITRHDRFSDPCIEISEADLISFSSTAGPLPPSTSVIFRLAGEKLFVEEAGGTSATALGARFSWDDRILAELKAIARREQLNNPDVLLADIAYIEDNLSAGVNVRRHFREYEIPVIVHSELPVEQQIELNDLYVSCQGDKVYLRSKRLGKYIIPMHGSAYNHERATLPLFRFLCHLQYQHVRYSFTFQMQQYLPGLDHYPRLEYKGCILSPAIWVLQADDFMDGSKADPDRFYGHARRIFLSRYFTWGQHDNQLVFDLYDNSSVSLFLDSVKNQKDIILSEYFIPYGTTCTHNEEGKKFVSQYVGALLNTASSFIQPAIHPQATSQAIQRCFVPGNKWLYFKIYGHPAMSVALLMQLLPLIRRFERSGELSCWFFVRYADPAPHLRLRLQVRPDTYGSCLNTISRLLQKFVDKGSVHNFCMDVYRRELERYGAANISLAEKIFEHSSCSVLKVASGIKGRGDPATMAAGFALLSADRLIAATIPKLADRLAFARLIYESFRGTFSITKQTELELDKQYRLIAVDFKSADLAAKFGYDVNVCVEQMATKTNQLVNSNGLGGDIIASRILISDILHMHLNRLFAKKQREQETAVYYFLIKYYNSCIGREKAGLFSAC